MGNDVNNDSLMHLHQVGHIILSDLSWNICLKWHISWRNRTSANRIAADKALKHCITLKVHSRPASQLYTGSATLGGETSIMLKKKFFFPQASDTDSIDSSAKLFVAFLLSQKNFFSLVFHLFCRGCHLFQWPGDKRGNDHSSRDLSLDALAQTVHEIRSHYNADVNMVTLTNPAADQKQAVGQGDVRLIWFAIEFKWPCVYKYQNSRLLKWSLGYIE